jgi:DNA replication and repair protein RecF
VRLGWIEARDFRSHGEVSLSVPDGLTAVVGPNARGKTNLLEAIHFLLALESPRTSSDLPLVRWGAESAFLRGEAHTEGGRVLIEVEIKAGGQNQVRVNRSSVRRRRDVRKLVRCVFCGPDDLHLVLGDPGERRRFMDVAVRTLWPARDGLAPLYERVLRQRNRLLKDWVSSGSGEPEGLEGWDAELARSGAALTEARREAMARLEDRAAREFGSLAGEPAETLVVEYRPSVEGEPLEEAFRVRLEQRRGDELIRRTTLVGPHRDELALSVHGLAARGFASHGEAWGAAVSLRLALADAVGEEIGESPVVLLDDPFSGLDPGRRARLAAGLDGRGQVLMAVPDEAHIPDGATVWSATEDGIVPR